MKSNPSLQIQTTEVICPRLQPVQCQARTGRPAHGAPPGGHSWGEAGKAINLVVFVGRGSVQHGHSWRPLKAPQLGSEGLLRTEATVFSSPPPTLTPVSATTCWSPGAHHPG
jgi:hypothetical protein